MSSDQENQEIEVDTPKVDDTPKDISTPQPPADMGNYMEMMQNMMQMYMSNPEMQKMMNSQMQQAMAMKNPPQIQVTQPKEQPNPKIEEKEEDNEAQQTPEKQVKVSKENEVKPGAKKENLANRIDRMFQEEAEDLDDFYNHFEHSGRKSSYHHSEYEPAPRSSIYNEGSIYNPRYGNHLQEPFGPNHNVSSNSGMMLEAESEFMPLRDSHKSIEYEGDDRLNSPYKGPSKFAREDETAFRVSEDSPYKRNTRDNRGSFRDSQRPSMAGRRYNNNTRRHNLQPEMMQYDLPNTSSFVNHEQNLAEDSQYDAFRRNSSGKKANNSPYKKFEEDLPITESRYSPNRDDDNRPINPASQDIYYDERPLNNGSGTSRGGRFDSNSQQDDRPIKQNSTPEKDTFQSNNINVNKREEESPPYYDPYQDREPIATNNSHDQQKVAGAKKSFEQLLEEQLKKEGAIYEPSPNKAPPKVKKPFLKKGTRKVLSNGRVKSKPKKSSAASSVKRNNFVKKSPKKPERKANEEMNEDEEEDENEDEDDFGIPNYNVSDFLKEEPSKPNSSQKEKKQDFDEIEDTVKLDEDGNPVEEKDEEDEEDNDNAGYDDQEEINDPWGNDKKLADDIKNMYSEEKPKKQEAAFDDEKVWDDEEPIESEDQNNNNDKDGHDDGDDDFQAKNQQPKKNKVVSKYFEKGKQSGNKNGNGNSQQVESIGSPYKQHVNEEEIVSRYVNDKIVELNAQIDKFKKQNQKLKSQKHELAEEKRAFEKEKTNFEAYIAAEKDRIKEKWDEELKKIKREKKIAERNHKAMINKPNRKEREEIEALKASVTQLESEKRQKEKKLKFTVDRQKKQIMELEKKNGQLQEQVLMYEQMRLRQDSQPTGAVSTKTPKSKAKKPTTQKSQVRRRERSSNDLKSRSGLDDDSEETDNFQKYENMVEGKNVYKKSQKKTSPKFVKEEVYGQVNPHEDSDEEGDDFQAIEDKLMNKNNYESEEEIDEGDDPELGPFKLDIDVNEYNFNSNTFYKRYLKEKNVRLQVVDESISPNGKIQRTYANGKKEVVFGNGAKREVKNLFIF